MNIVLCKYFWLKNYFKLIVQQSKWGFVVLVFFFYLKFSKPVWSCLDVQKIKEIFSKYEL